MKLERELGAQLDQSSQAMDGGFVATHSTPSQHASRREQAVLLADALEQLPADYREVIVLRHLEALPLPRGGRADGPQRGQRAEAVGAGAGEPAQSLGRRS